MTDFLLMVCGAVFAMVISGIVNYKKSAWVGLTDEDIHPGLLRSNHALQTAGAWRDGVEWATKQLREKNT